MRKIGFSPKEAIATIAKSIVTASSLSIGAQLPEAELYGSVAEGFIKGWNLDKKTSSIFDSLNLTIKNSIKSSINSDEFELPEDCKQDLVNEIFSFDNSRMYLYVNDSAVFFEDKIKDICARYDECDLDTLPVAKITETIVSYIDASLQSNHELSGLYVHLKMNQLIISNQEISRKLDLILDILAVPTYIQLQTLPVQRIQIPSNIIDDTNKFELDNIIEKYLKETFQKCSKMKTLYYSQFEKNISEFYVHPTLLCTDKNDKTVRLETLNTSRVLSLSKCLLIKGNAGSGKSMLMKYMFISSYQTGEFTPFFIELRKLKRHTTSIIDFVYKQLVDFGFEKGKKEFEATLKAGKYLFICDGYDELSDNMKKVFTAEITDLTRRFSKNHFVISSRPHEQFDKLNQFKPVEIDKLSRDQSLDLIKKLDVDIEVKKSFLGNLALDQFNTYKDYISNPLMLTMMLLSYVDCPRVPIKAHDFYDNIFSALFDRNDTIKDGYHRIFRSGLSKEEFRQLFSELCYSAYDKDLVSFTETDLQMLVSKLNSIPISIDASLFISDVFNNIPLILKDGLYYTFIHRSFQEYFASIYIDSLSDDEQMDVLKKLVTTKKDNIVLNMIRNFEPERYSKNYILMAFKKEKDIDKRTYILLGYFYPYIRTKSDAGDYICECRMKVSDDKFAKYHMFLFAEICGFKSEIYDDLSYQISGGGEYFYSSLSQFQLPIDRENAEHWYDEESDYDYYNVNTRISLLIDDKIITEVKKLRVFKRIKKIARIKDISSFEEYLYYDDK